MYRLPFCEKICRRLFFRFFFDLRDFFRYFDFLGCRRNGLDRYLFCHTLIVCHVQSCSQISINPLTQILGDSCYTALVQIDHSRLPVRVGVQFGTGVYDQFWMRQQVAVGCHMGMVVLHCLRQQLVILCQFFLATVLLEDNQVATHLGVGILGEEVVGHTHHRQQIGIPHHQEAGAVVALAVQHALRGEEGDDAAVTHGIESFQEEVVVNLLRRCPVHEGTLLVLRIEHGDVTEGNVGQGKVEMVVEGLFYLLESLYTHFAVGMKMAEHPARQ